MNSTQTPPTTDKPRVAVFCGARSTEHEVSLVSAFNIVKAIDKSKYEVFVVGISKEGVWKQYSTDDFATNADQGVGSVRLSDNPISGRLTVRQNSREFYDIDNNQVAFECDIVFPAVLGNYAEDGHMQGLLRMMDVPFTTADTLGSSVGFDKDLAYRLLRDAGLSVANFVTLRKQFEAPSFDSLTEEIGSNTLFIKPANAGSSVGVSRATDQESLNQALSLAFAYDVKVIVQAAVIGREVEISVSGNIGNMKTSVVGEIVEKDPEDFYSYENKYINSSNVELIAPADMSDDKYREISQAAVKVCEVLECEGFGRVDFFIDENDKIYVNEINTMPGFTAISMFPRLWGESGVSYPELVNWLLELAVERYNFRVAPIVTDASDIIKIANSIKAKF